MTLDEYNSLLKEFGHKCYICNGIDRLCIDHDHKTGKVRGILCNDCNLGLGYLRDNKTSMIKAIEYLTRIKRPSLIMRVYYKIIHKMFALHKKHKEGLREKELLKIKEQEEKDKYLWKIDNENNIADHMWIQLKDLKPEYETKIDIVDEDGDVYFNWYFTTNGRIEFFAIKPDHIIYIESIVKWRPTTYKLKDNKKKRRVKL